MRLCAEPSLPPSKDQREYGLTRFLLTQRHNYSQEVKESRKNGRRSPASF